MIRLIAFVLASVISFAAFGEAGDASNPMAIGPKEKALKFLLEARPEKGTYLGVSTSKVPAVLRDQLGLQRGVGLVVDHVTPDSPAAKAGVKQNDILEKLDDQVLVNAEQLAVLVRMHKPDDEVKLQIIREAKPQTLTARLVEQDVPALGLGGHLDLNLNMTDNPVIAKRLILNTDGFSLPQGASNFEVAWSDGKLNLKISKADDGGRHLLAKDGEGKVIFDGSIDTDEEMKKLPEFIREKLKTLKIMTLPTTVPADVLVKPGS